MGCVVADGTDASLVKELASAAETEGGVLKIVALRVARPK